ncbi:MAG TPA: 4-alpha-glucanotransferase [Acidisarcina sp.]|nr:4-alpha-glucanotransferase [Acidisarcina sp.]
MQFPRSSGILLHPTSLPGAYGVGDFGSEAYRFVDFLKASGQKLWQVLPLNPTGYGDSPFQCFSATAGNPLLLSLERLRDDGLLQQNDLDSAPLFAAEQVEYQRVIEFKTGLLTKAALTFFQSSSADLRRNYQNFCIENAMWLDDFALFMAVKNQFGGVAWTRWPAEIAARQPAALVEWTSQLASEIEVIKYWQFEFFRQWQSLRSYAQDRGVQVIGDIPIYVAHDSADVWTNRKFFYLDEQGNPLKMAGVPPDYFSATGQLWGNPIYNWPLLEQTGFRWWIDRFRSALRLYDIVRIDHFRGFEAYWEVPGSETTAINGQWVKGPGATLFEVLQAELGPLPVIAENLGRITPEVEAIRHQFGFPGMAILQFGFGTDEQAHTFRPHNLVRELVTYTGTHDNNTITGWWTSKGDAGDSVNTPEDVAKEHDFAHRYLNFGDQPVHWAFIRAALASVANTAIVPLQDLLGLGTDARMNLPGTSSGNWRWRCKPGALTPELAKQLRQLVLLYER